MPDPSKCADQVDQGLRRPVCNYRHNFSRSVATAGDADDSVNRSPGCEICFNGFIIIFRVAQDIRSRPFADIGCKSSSGGRFVGMKIRYVLLAVFADEKKNAFHGADLMVREAFRGFHWDRRVEAVIHDPSLTPPSPLPF